MAELWSLTTKHINNNITHQSNCLSELKYKFGYKSSVCNIWIIPVIHWHLQIENWVSLLDRLPSSPQILCLFLVGVIRLLVNKTCFIISLKTKCRQNVCVDLRIYLPATIMNSWIMSSLKMSFFHKPPFQGSPGQNEQEHKTVSHILTHKYTFKTTKRNNQFFFFMCASYGIGLKNFWLRIILTLLLFQINII